MNRIICVGNRGKEDAAGPKVFDRLVESALCEGVEMIDGSFDDLDRLDLLEQTGRVVIVDTLTGFGRPGEVMVIANALEELERPLVNGHLSKLGYLHGLRAKAAGRLTPEVLVVGVEPPFDDFDLDMAADLSLGLIRERSGEPVHPFTEEKDIA